MNVNNKQEELLEATEAAIDEGIDSWANDHPADGTGEPVTGRVQQHAQIMRDREEYRDLYRSSSSRFGEVINEAVKDKDLQRMTGALLYLAAAGYKDRDGRSDLIGDGYDQKPAEVAEFVLKIDHYSILDEYTVDQIVDRIENEDDDIYRLYKNELKATREGIQDIDPEAALENDQEASFLQTVLTERQDKMTKAAQRFTETTPLYEILSTLEDAILDAGEAAQTREEITETVKTEIADLEEQLQWALRTQRELFISEVDTMTAELEVDLLSSDEFTAELTGFEDELQWAFREHREFLLKEFETHAETDAEHLTSQEMIALLDEQRDDIVDSLEGYLTQSQSEIQQQLSDLSDKQQALTDAIDTIEQNRDDIPAGEVEALIETELQQLTDQRDELDALIDRFEREQARLEAEVESLQNAPTPPEPITEDSDGVEGAEVIPASVARLYETDFIARIDRSVRDADTIKLPTGGTLTPEASYWNNQSRSEHGSFQGSIVADLADDAQIQRYPERSWVRFATVESAGLLGQSEETELVIEGLTLTRLSRYAEHGSDWAPATLSELHTIVGEAIDRGLVRGQDDAHHLLIIGSPTGWRDRVIDEVESGSLFDPDVSVCLVDLHTDERYYSRQDSLLRGNEWVFSHELPDEEILEVEETIETDYADDPKRDRILLHEVVDNHGVGPHIVKRAFNRLEARGIGSQVETDRGLLLSFNLR